MWIKAILPVGMLALAVAPGLAPVAVPAPPKTPAVTAQGDAPFAASCRDGEAADIRPDPAWMLASFDNDGCRMAPIPASLDGTLASREEIVSAMARTKRYEASAEAFARCVSNFVAVRVKSEKPLTIAQGQIETHRLLVGARSSQAAEARMRTAINDFNMYGSDCPD